MKTTEKLLEEVLYHIKVANKLLEEVENSIKTNVLQFPKRFWDHNCSVTGETAVEMGKECNYCGCIQENEEINARMIESGGGMEIEWTPAWEHFCPVEKVNVLRDLGTKCPSCGAVEDLE